MLDCTKHFADLTPYEAYQCFLQADIWQTVGKNVRRMWADFTGTTIGEWGGIVFAFALVPAQLASYILPLYFCWLVLRRYVAKDVFVLYGKEHRHKNFWGAYLLLSGLVIIALYSHDLFMLLQGGWEATCGAAIFLLGPSWWAHRSPQKSVASR
jgi:hypothetical protein